MRICDPCSDLALFHLSLTRIDVCLSTVQIVIASQKVKEKQADCRICLIKFLEMWKGIS